MALIAPGQSGWLVAAWIAPAPLSILLLPMLSVLLSVLGIIAEPVAWVAWVPTMAAIAAAQVVLAARLLDAMKRGSCWWRMRRFCIRKA
ncbi:MAG TPA: hypothetical protein VHV82_06050 [Sporichthyaceae bacterium]|nr:hypothetical protein [Sporichthyaceae bacterium]